MIKILLLQGPNLNLLGQREPHIYGYETLEELHAGLLQEAFALNFQLECYQSNAEHQLVERIHQALIEQVDYILINPAAFTHTSVALRDALAGVAIPFIEIHLSNIYARETFRQHSYLSELAQGVICGLGTQGYYLALQAVDKRLSKNLKK
ncbi:type II 3-dehydroquinate dehydratase [Marinospirillum insulare]|uniref:3-dehydroquinate dehydratase n=1 Tax=Marinospirillum insulare TaxID=217169 RepID=A0ABQ5ZZE3_9GAMM|nr:type II 3-dehydroquinate dehydratase [Marinospirillum insulare]GLR64757.1 3-dehydroquinate dehydratase [Marinospirillum insulare]